MESSTQVHKHTHIRTHFRRSPWFTGGGGGAGEVRIACVCVSVTLAGWRRLSRGRR